VAERSRSSLLASVVNAEALALILIADALVRLLRLLWRGVENPYDRDEVEQFTRSASVAVVRARRYASGVSDSYMRQVLDLMEVTYAGLPEPVPAEPRGIPLTKEYERPAKVYRRARLLGLDKLLADDRAIARAEQLATMDVALAARDARASRLALAENVVGWRRLVHPELEAVPGHPPGPVCGLCLVASDRIYRKLDKQQLHEFCRCTIAPVTATNDPGADLHAENLRRIYADAGNATDRQSLAKTRYRVELHAELGPVLVNAKHAFRGPGDVRPDAPDLAAAAAAELAEVQERLRLLLAREAAGEEVSAPIAWNVDRVTALRELTGAA
jgi:hypothetical protein